MIDTTEHLKVIEAKNADARIDSRILAEHLGLQSETVMRLLKTTRMTSRRSEYSDLKSEKSSAEDSPRSSPC